MTLFITMAVHMRSILSEGLVCTAVYWREGSLYVLGPGNVDEAGLWIVNC